MRLNHDTPQSFLHQGFLTFVYAPSLSSLGIFCRRNPLFIKDEVWTLLGLMGNVDETLALYLSQSFLHQG
jgi:hypothetical protein